MIDLKSLREGDLIEGRLAVRSIDAVGQGIKDYSNKPGRFFVIDVGNHSGDVLLKYWGGKNPEKVTKLFDSIRVGDVVSVKGKFVYDSYSKKNVISINEEVKYGGSEETLKKVSEGEFAPTDFLPSKSEGEIESLFSELENLIQSVSDEGLKTLLEAFFKDSEFSTTFKKTPAARKHHHNYLGGLLEHSLNVAKLCDKICEFYPLDRDLLISGALLHDLGKTKEYTLKASVDVSSEGRLIGHLPLTMEMVRLKMTGVADLSEERMNMISHMMLSHHGELEKGSPKEPAFPEAVALFHADYMDAFVKNTLQELEEVDEEWTYSRGMRRMLYKKGKKRLEGKNERTYQ
jgi:3'-5' exoribonuclease